MSYELFPKPTQAEIALYRGKALPSIPNPNYYTIPSSASYESLLEHEVPSPSLYESEEFSQLWSRISYSTFSEKPSTVSTYFSGTFDSLEKSEPPSESVPRERRQTLLPPAPELRLSTTQVEAVDCRLSSSSSTVTPTISLPSSRRSAQHSSTSRSTSDPEELTDHSIPPSTPVPSLSSSQSRASTEQGDRLPSISSTTIHIMFSPGSEDEGTSSGTRQIYQVQRTVPPAPLPVRQVSGFDDWEDEDDQRPRLTRMKKSFTNLAAATRSRTDVSGARQIVRKPPFLETTRRSKSCTTEIPPPPPVPQMSNRAGVSLPALGHHQTCPYHCADTALPAWNLTTPSKKANSTSSRNRAASNASKHSSGTKLSHDSTLIGTPVSSKSKNRSGAYASQKSRRLSFKWLRRCWKKVFGC